MAKPHACVPLLQQEPIGFNACTPGATAGRTTLAGEGLQHQDGHSLLHASTVPNCLSYDCAFAYELAIVVQEGIRRMYKAGENIFYYLTVYNETYNQPAQPKGVEEGVLKGLYKFKPASRPGKLPRVHLFGSGPLINEALRAQEILRKDYKVAADVWSATSYNLLYRDALDCTRWNRLHPGKKPRVPHIAAVLANEPWPIVVTSDYVSSVAERLCPWTPAGMSILSTDGFGRSDARADLRRHFEISAEQMVFAALSELANRKEFDGKQLPGIIKKLGINPDAPNPATA
jgi:pyruvate dehydrogenase E1 component